MLVIEEDYTLSICCTDPDNTVVVVLLLLFCCCCFVVVVLLLLFFARKCLSVKRSYSNKTKQRSTGYFLRNVFLKIET